MDKERFTKDAKYKVFMLALHYWQAQEAKLEMMREHPEWFETTSPNEYGMKLMKRKHRK